MKKTLLALLVLFSLTSCFDDKKEEKKANQEPISKEISVVRILKLSDAKTADSLKALTALHDEYKATYGNKVSPFEVRNSLDDESLVLISSKAPSKEEADSIYANFRDLQKSKLISQVPDGLQNDLAFEFFPKINFNPKGEAIEVSIFKVTSPDLKEAVEVANNILKEEKEISGNGIIDAITLQSVRDPSIFIQIINWNYLNDAKTASGMFTQLKSAKRFAEITDSNVFLGFFAINPKNNSDSRQAVSDEVVPATTVTNTPTPTTIDPTEIRVNYGKPVSKLVPVELNKEEPVKPEANSFVAPVENPAINPTINQVAPEVLPAPTTIPAQDKIPADLD